jgi:heme oxygenase
MHQALDRALMPAGTPWTLDRYVRFLRGTLAVLASAEPALIPVLPDVAPSRVSRLRHDLAQLGADATVLPSSAFATPPAPAAALGASYVIESSQLGGLQVATAVAADLRIGGAGLTYLRPADAPVGARWNAFVARLDAFGATATASEWRSAEVAAIDTYAAFATAFRREGVI